MNADCSVWSYRIKRPSKPFVCFVDTLGTPSSDVPRMFLSIRLVAVSPRGQLFEQSAFICGICVQGFVVRFFLIAARTGYRFVSALMAAAVFF